MPACLCIPRRPNFRTPAPFKPSNLQKLKHVNDQSLGLSNCLKPSSSNTLARDIIPPATAHPKEQADNTIDNGVKSVKHRRTRRKIAKLVVSRSMEFTTLLHGTTQTTIVELTTKSQPKSYDKIPRQIPRERPTQSSAMQSPRYATSRKPREGMAVVRETGTKSAPPQLKPVTYSS